MTRKERERTMHQREIMAAARSMFARKGFNQTTMEDIALSAEFGKGTIYNYFGSKEELFRAVLDDSFSQVLALVRGTMDSSLPFRRKIETLANDLLEYALDNPDSLYLMVRESQLLCRDNPLLERFPEVMTLIADQIAEGQRQGIVFREIGAQVLAQVLMNIILGRFMNIMYTRHEEHTGESAKGHGFPGRAIFDEIRADDLAKEKEEAIAVVQRVFLYGISLSGPGTT